MAETTKNALHPVCPNQLWPMAGNHFSGNNSAKLETQLVLPEQQRKNVLSKEMLDLFIWISRYSDVTNTLCRISTWCSLKCKPL